MVYVVDNEGCFFLEVDPAPPSVRDSSKILREIWINGSGTPMAAYSFNLTANLPTFNHYITKEQFEAVWTLYYQPKIGGSTLG